MLQGVNLSEESLLPHFEGCKEALVHIVLLSPPEHTVKGGEIVSKNSKYENCLFALIIHYQNKRCYAYWLHQPIILGMYNLFSHKKYQIIISYSYRVEQ